MTPCMVATLTEHKGFAFLFSTLPVFGLWSLNYIAAELEVPFGRDANDLPLVDFQLHMNNSLLMLSLDEADIIPGISSNGCKTAYKDMKDSIATKRPGYFLEHPDRKPSFDLTLGGGPVAVVTIADKPAAPQTSAEALKLPPAPPAPSPAALETTTVLQSLQSNFEELTSNTAKLSTQIAGSSDTIQGFAQQLERTA